MADRTWQEAYRDYVGPNRQPKPIKMEPSTSIPRYEQERGGLGHIQEKSPFTLIQEAAEEARTNALAGKKLSGAPIIPPTEIPPTEIPKQPVEPSEPATKMPGALMSGPAGEAGFRKQLVDGGVRYTQPVDMGGGFLEGKGVGVGGTFSVLGSAAMSTPEEIAAKGKLALTKKWLSMPANQRGPRPRGVDPRFGGADPIDPNKGPLIVGGPPTLDVALRQYAAGDLRSSGHRMIRNLLVGLPDEKSRRGKEITKSQMLAGLIKQAGQGSAGGGGASMKDAISMMNLQRNQAKDAQASQMGLANLGIAQSAEERMLRGEKQDIEEASRARKDAQIAALQEQTGVAGERINSALPSLGNIGVPLAELGAKHRLTGPQVGSEVRSMLKALGASDNPELRKVSEILSGEGPGYEQMLAGGDNANQVLASAQEVLLGKLNQHWSQQ